MKSDEQRIAEAVASLRHRLEAKGIEDAAELAGTYVNDMLRNGWRPRALPLPPVTQPATPGLPPPDTYRAARAALHPHHTKENQP